MFRIPHTARRNVFSGVLLISSALALLCIPLPSHADTDDGERAQLAAMVRQLDQLQRQAKQTSALASQERRRYHLDFARLQEDLQRIEVGLQAYLTPPRAQPRDIEPLSANYRVDGEAGAPGRAAPQQAERTP
jgi:RAQPRD family integrative conjugative element protein